MALVQRLCAIQVVADVPVVLQRQAPFIQNYSCFHSVDVPLMERRPEALDRAAQEPDGVLEGMPVVSAIRPGSAEVR